MALHNDQSWDIVAILGITDPIKPDRAINVRLDYQATLVSEVSLVEEQED